MSTEASTSHEVAAVEEARTELASHGTVVVDLIEYRQEQETGPEAIGSTDAGIDATPPLMLVQSAPPADIIAFPLNLDLSGVQEQSAVITAPAPMVEQQATVTTIPGRSTAARVNSLEHSLGRKAA
jgi:hypothetical protein